VLKALATAVSQSLSTTVVSRAIQSLKDDPALSTWVHQGFRIHQDQHSEKCLFCEQTLPQDRLDALEAHFSTEYEQFLKRLNAQIGELQAASKAAATLTLPNRAELYEDLAAAYEVTENSLRGALD
jgi:wobble nucleotide-excising tRNase